MDKKIIYFSNISFYFREMCMSIESKEGDKPTTPKLSLRKIIQSIFHRNNHQTKYLYKLMTVYSE